jgi:hypothetical protein
MCTTNSQKLFLVCPFCQLEPGIRQQFGDAYFLTAPAGIFRFSAKYLDCIRNVIDREQIEEIISVASADCNFIQTVLLRQASTGMPCEQIIQRLMQSGDDAKTLAEKIVADQLQKLRNEDHFGPDIDAGTIKVSGMLIHKKPNQTSHQILLS